MGGSPREEARHVLQSVESEPLLRRLGPKRSVASEVHVDFEGDHLSLWKV